MSYDLSHFACRRLPDLEAALWSAHQGATRRAASAQAAEVAANGSGSYVQAIIAALATLGFRHGPVESIRDHLAKNDAVVQAGRVIASGGILPGWGSSFVKGTDDHLWSDTRAATEEHEPDLVATIDSITSLFHQSGKKIYPNGGCYTAAAALALRLPARATQYLLVAPRLPIWSAIVAEALG